VKPKIESHHTKKHLPCSQVFNTTGKCEVLLTVHLHFTLDVFTGNCVVFIFFR